jgi:hypothetical protein
MEERAERFRERGDRRDGRERLGDGDGLGAPPGAPGSPPATP